MQSDEITLRQIIEFLLQTPMFEDLSPSELTEVVPLMEVQRLAAGQTIFEEGQPGDAWYVVYRGSVGVLKQVGEEERTLTELSDRACFGEMAVLDGSPRSATVRATTAAVIIRFPRLGFSRLLDGNNVAVYKLVHQMACVLVARQRWTTARLAELMGESRVDPEALKHIVQRSSPTE